MGKYSKKTIKSLGGGIALLLIASLIAGAVAYTYFIKVGETDNVEVITSLQYSTDGGTTWLDAGDVDLTLEYNDYPGNTESLEVMIKWLGDDMITITPVVMDDQVNGIYGKMYEDTTEITSFSLIPEDIDTRTITFSIEVDQLVQPGTYTVTFVIDGWVITGGG